MFTKRSASPNGCGRTAQRCGVWTMTGTGVLTNALLSQSLALPPMDLVGPTVEDDIRRAIGRYGGEAVKAAALKLTKRKRGNPGINPLPDLWCFFQRDADEWLAGGDPF